MPREIVFKIKRKVFKTSLTRVDRRKLYGWTELTAVDQYGAPCSLLSVDESGKFIIAAGGTGIGILSESGKWVERSELKTLGADGKPAPLFKSSFNRLNVLKDKDKVTPQEFLDYDITDFYELSTATSEMKKAVSNDIYRFEYNYHDSYAPSPAFIMAANEKLYLLVAVKNAFEYLSFDNCESIDEAEEEEELLDDDGDIDFSMF